jgi:hypothetical protein
MRVRLLVSAAAFVVCLSAHAVAQQALDPAAARAQLEQGYGLKVQGKYAEALPHLVESQRLDPQLKTLFNLADCEEHVGKLVDAQRHWLQARDMAAQPGSPAQREADSRLSALEQRMPRLVIRLAAGAPAASEAARDGVPLGAVSLGTPLPADPGKHTVVARAAGYADRSFDVVLKEGETQTVDVAPGDKIAAPAPALPPAPIAPAAPAATAPPPLASTPPLPVSSGSSSLATIGLVTAGIGVVGLGLGTAFGVDAISKKNDAASSGCSGNVCTPSAGATRNDAQSAGNLSTVFFVAGGVLAAAGVTVWLVAPGSSHAVEVAPSVGRGGAGVTLAGSWL